MNETTGWHQCLLFPAMHCHCFFGDRKDVRPVKKLFRVSMQFLLRNKLMKTGGGEICQVQVYLKKGDG